MLKTILLFLAFLNSGISINANAQDVDAVKMQHTLPDPSRLQPHIPLQELTGLHSSITSEMLAVAKNKMQFSKIW